MITTTPSVSDTSSSVSATAALSCMQGELTGELCTLAGRLAQFVLTESHIVIGACLACGNLRTGNAILHADSCTINQVLDVVGRLENLRLEQRRVSEAAVLSSERKIVYRDPASDLASEIPAPVGLSHVEAAVLQAAGVPPEQRSAIYAEAMARQAGDAMKAGR